MCTERHANYLSSASASAKHAAFALLLLTVSASERHALGNALRNCWTSNFANIKHRHNAESTLYILFGGEIEPKYGDNPIRQAASTVQLQLAMRPLSHRDLKQASRFSLLANVYNAWCSLNEFAVSGLSVSLTFASQQTCPQMSLSPCIVHHIMHNLCDMLSHALHICISLLSMMVSVQSS